MKNTKFQCYLDQVDTLTVKQRKLLIPRLTEQTAQEEVLSQIEERVEEDSECPHCHSTHIQRWGTTNNLQRYRCCHCDKTFTGLTGTPLARLKHKDKWLAYMATIIDGETQYPCPKGMGLH